LRSHSVLTSGRWPSFPLPLWRYQSEMGLPYSGWFAERKIHRSNYNNMVRIADKTADRKVFDVLPIDMSGITNMRHLSCPLHNLVHRCFLGPVQPGSASDDGAFDNRWVSGSEENRSPNRSIRPIQARVPDELRRFVTRAWQIVP
jgi:hypothetical protein